MIFTGDIIYSKPALENMRNVLKTVSDSKIPFSIVFGNHDNEQGATKEELLKVAESLPYSLTADEVPEISGVGNYALTVRSSDGKKDAFVLYCIDSNTYSTIKGVKDTIILSVTRSIGIVRKARVYPNNGESRFLLWLSSISRCRNLIKRLPMRMPNSMAYVEKKACAPALNSGLFTAIKENGDVMGIFVGHDHDDDYAVCWHDVLLAYGRFTGGPTEYIHLPNGARIIELNEGARTFKTWIRTKAGVESSLPIRIRS